MNFDFNWDITLLPLQLSRVAFINLVSNCHLTYNPQLPAFIG